jgi:REP element-mobilizing transposase RayT
MVCCAIHVIWTTYMTWPPGDPRGHWSPLFDFYGHLIDDGHHLNIADPTTLTHAIGLAKEPPKVLAPDEQRIVAETIGEVLRTQTPPSRTRILAAAIERTHVHLLLSRVDEPIDRAVGRLKGRASSEVIARGAEPERKRTWTAGFWKVFLFEARSVPVVGRYIEAHNERRGLARAPYEWVTPAWG